MGTTLGAEIAADRGSTPQCPGIEQGGAAETSTEPGMDASSSPDRAQAAVLARTPLPEMRVRQTAISQAQAGLSRLITN